MIYNFAINKSNGEPLNLSLLKGKVVLLVNTATKCGLANQFTELEQIHQKYKDQGLIIIGFPCNQFLSQEPESNETMASSCEINFGVHFTLTEKIDVNGSNTHPIFAYLKKEKGGFLTPKIKWNFTKFIVNKKGKVVKRFSPTTSPLKMEDYIQKLLAE